MDNFPFDIPIQIDEILVRQTLKLFITHIRGFHKLDEIGNNVNIGTRGFTT